jgi:hypothetical protein
MDVCIIFWFEIDINMESMIQHVFSLYEKWCFILPILLDN